MVTPKGCDQVSSQRQYPSLYRRARAYEQRHEYDLAERDLESALELEPSNRSLAKHLSNVRQQVRQQHADMARGLSKMFSS